MGKRIVELFSEDISLKLCKYLSCRASGCGWMMPAASESRVAACYSPSALQIDFYSFQDFLDFLARPCFFILSGARSDHEEIISSGHDP